jgi:hypothetical protein
MTDQRARAALSRIEAALSRISRIEFAAPPPRDAATERAHAELAARHDALRGETRKAIAELESVLGGLQTWQK